MVRAATSPVRSPRSLSLEMMSVEELVLRRARRPDNAGPGPGPRTLLELGRLSGLSTLESALRPLL